MTEPLDSLALVVRNARNTKGWSQERAAKKAGVSRRQWAALEAGENVSVTFLAKVIDVLELPHVPIGTKGARAVPVAAIVDALQLFGLAETMSRNIDELRSFAVTLLTSTPGAGRDAAAIEEYVRERPDSKTSTSADVARVSTALRRFASDVLLSSSQLDNGDRTTSAQPARRKKE